MEIDRDDYGRQELTVIMEEVTKQLAARLPRLEEIWWENLFSLEIHRSRKGRVSSLTVRQDYKLSEWQLFSKNKWLDLSNLQFRFWSRRLVDTVDNKNESVYIDPIGISNWVPPRDGWTEVQYCSQKTPIFLTDWKSLVRFSCYVTYQMICLFITLTRTRICWPAVPVVGWWMRRIWRSPGFSPLTRGRCQCRWLDKGLLFGQSEPTYLRLICSNLVQTALFVVFNKAYASQVCLLILFMRSTTAVLPVVTPPSAGTHPSLSRTKAAAGVAVRVAVQTLWLSEAYVESWGSDAMFCICCRNYTISLHHLCDNPQVR